MPHPCRAIQDDLPQLLLGELDAERAAEVTVHLETQCDACGAELAELTRGIDSIWEDFASPKPNEQEAPSNLLADDSNTLSSVLRRSTQPAITPDLSVAGGNANNAAPTTPGWPTAIITGASLTTLGYIAAYTLFAILSPGSQTAISNAGPSFAFPMPDPASQYVVLTDVSHSKLPTYSQVRFIYDQESAALHCFFKDLPVPEEGVRLGISWPQASEKLGLAFVDVDSGGAGQLIVPNLSMQQARQARLFFKDGF